MAIKFTLPGFSNINDPDLLQMLLNEYIMRVREIDAPANDGPNQPKTMEENDMIKDELITLNALRVMRAYRAVYGHGLWNDSLLEYGFLRGPGWHPLIERLSADLSVIIRQDGLRRS